MKSPTTKKPARKTPRSKNPARVDRQLDSLSPKGTDVVVDSEKPTGADTTKAMAEPKSESSEITRGMLGKVRRAHVKAGIAEPTQDVLEAFARKLLTAGVPIRERSSTRIAKTIKGESEIAALK